MLWILCIIGWLTWVHWQHGTMMGGLVRDYSWAWPTNDLRRGPVLMSTNTTTGDITLRCGHEYNSAPCVLDHRSGPVDQVCRYISTKYCQPGLATGLTT
ncbi:hypothetical protein AAMO2058_000415300 [Amorphochlora amoebiformis]